MIREVYRYLIIGFLTTLISFVSFTLMSEVLHAGITVCNTISWILAVSFAFVTNKTIVFDNKDKISKKQVVLFFAMRTVSLVIETLLILILVNALLCNRVVSKAITQVVVIILNYVLSKFIVFKK